MQDFIVRATCQRPVDFHSRFKYKRSRSPVNCAPKQSQITRVYFANPLREGRLLLEEYRPFFERQSISAILGITKSNFAHQIAEKHIRRNGVSAYIEKSES